MTAGTYTPRPGAAPLHRMVLAQTAVELRLTLRRGDSVLLTLVIPVLLLAVLASTPVVSVGGSRVDFYVPGVIALAVMSMAFTGQAIATGFERQQGVLKRLGATALPRSGLMLAKTAAVAGVEVVQLVLIVLVGLALGWSPHGSPAAVVLLVVVGTAAFSGLGLLMAGTLRAETTLAAANLVWFVLLGAGGVVFPLSDYPAAARGLLELLPLTALADGLRAVLRNGAGVPVHNLVILLVWAAAALAAAAATFRWE
jgi:ABC-2 type transport system permease protein